MMSETIWIRYYKNGQFTEELTFEAVQQQIEHVSTFLSKEGLVAGDRVLVRMVNSPQAVIAYLALKKSKMIAVPVNPNESENWLQYVYRHCNARAMLSAEGIKHFEITNDHAKPVADNIMTIVYTSGTTGAPKGVCLSWSQWQTNGVALNVHHYVTTETVHASPLPLYHCNAHGFSMFGTYLARCRWILVDKVTNRFLDIINEERVEIVSLVPALLARLLREHYSWKPHGKLRYIVTAAAPLPAYLANEVLNAWKVRVIQGYGLSESTNFSCTMPVDLSEDTYHLVMNPHPSIGVALPGVEMRIGDHDQQNQVGELYIRSGSNCMGYWKEGPYFIDWLSTGDLGYYRIIDGRRFYYITGRIKEQINRGGETLSPIAIEEELRQLGITGEFAIVPIPHLELGEEVGLISLVPIDERIIMHIPWHRRPKKITLVDHIPQTPTGKIQRRKAAMLI